MSALLGCIADDFTGGTDLAGMLVKAGMRTVLLIDTTEEIPPDDVDAIVIALKSRTIPADQAVTQSLAALAWLQKAGCQQFYFKYCSTFDSTARGNIGPVTEALMQALQVKFTIACPAFPTNGRSVYNGYLFVNDVLLSESGMRDHPLTPMTDPSLVRVLQAQSRGRVGLIPYTDVAKGASAIQERMAKLTAQGIDIAIADALTDPDLISLGHACADMPLITGASGLVQGLPGNFRRRGLLQAAQDATRLPRTNGRRAVIAGSCSVATQRQVALMRDQAPSQRIDVAALLAGADIVGDTLEWATQHLPQGPVLIYSTSSPDEVRRIQAASGLEHSGTCIEHAFAAIAQGLVDQGVRQLIVAGGETSGAVAQALAVSGLRIGSEIDPGVPWTVALSSRTPEPLALALKSGNFGSDDFFLKAWNLVP